MRTVTLPDGTTVPQLGLGTWRMGEDRGHAKQEVAAVRQALDLGMTLIDTAEMYGEGGAEEVVGEALAGRRYEAFVVSKVYPHNASAKGVVAACERSLRRLRSETLDLYLLHWTSSHPIAETIEGFRRLVRDGKILRWGVSNLDTDEMAAMWAEEGGTDCATNQVLYNLVRRGIEFDLLPWQRERRMPTMAYSPLEQGRRLGGGALEEIGRRHGATAMQVALAWVMRDPDVIAIPKAANPEHLKANRAAADLRLDADDLAALDAAFPPPTRKEPLAIL